MNKLAKEFAYRVLELERKLAAYQRVHAEELDELENLLSELKEQILSLYGDQEIDLQTNLQKDSEDAPPN